MSMPRNLTKFTFNVFMAPKAKRKLELMFVERGINANQFLIAVTTAFITGDIETNSVDYGKMRSAIGVTTTMDDLNVVSLFDRSGNKLNTTKLTDVMEVEEI